MPQPRSLFQPDWLAVSFMIRITEEAGSFGFAERTSAAMPVTWGAAIEVPNR